MHRSSKLTIIYLRNTENEIILAPLNLHNLLLLVLMYVRLCVKPDSSKKGFTTVSARVAFGYTREVWGEHEQKK